MVARYPFRQFQLVEVAPTIIIPDVAALVVREGALNGPPNVLEDYVYPLDLGTPSSPMRLNGSSLLVLGWGMLYNDCPNELRNLGWELVKMPAATRQGKRHKLTDYAVVFRVIRDIRVGEELCWNYGPAYWSRRERK